jgi:hypothetical protein
LILISLHILPSQTTISSKGSDEDAVRNFFTPRILEYFQAHHGLSVEVFNGTLVFFRLGEWIKPDDIRTLIDDALEIHQTLLPQ